MIYILIGLAFISCGLVSYILIMGLYWKKLKVQYRLAQVGQAYQDNMELDDRRKLPFKNRIIDPMLEKIKQMIGKITPEGMREQIEKQLKAANYPYGFSVTGWLIFRLVFSIVLPCGFLMILRIDSMNIVSKLLLLAIFTVLCILFPNIVLKGRIKSRRKKLQQQLPDILDLLTISVEAGLSFDGALERIVEKDRGELAQEFGKVLQEMQFGKTRREALTDMVERCEVGDLKIFISTMIQAERLGVSIGKVLRIQAEQMRDKRKQRAQEQAMKAPVRMIIPLVVFIFPSIFIVILGPALIQIKEMFL